MLSSLAAATGLVALLSNQNLQARDAFPTQGLADYWSFNEDRGNTVYDSTTNDNTGVLSSGAKWTRGKNDSGLNFNGTSGYVSLSQLPTTETSDFSIFAWVKDKSSTGNRQSIISYGSATENPIELADPYESLYLSLNNKNQLQFDLADVNGPVGPKKMKDGLWYNVGVVNHNGNIQLYIDGTPDGNPMAMTPDIIRGYQTIGASYGNGQYGSFFNGKIDEVGVWDRALNGNEISELYNCGKGNFYNPECTPEPSTLALMALAGAGAMALKRKKK